MVASESKKEKGVNLKEGEVIKIISLIRDINNKAIKKKPKGLLKRRAATASPNL